MLGVFGRTAPRFYRTFTREWLRNTSDARRRTGKGVAWVCACLAGHRHFARRISDLGSGGRVDAVPVPRELPDDRFRRRGHQPRRPHPRSLPRSVGRWGARLRPPEQRRAAKEGGFAPLGADDFRGGLGGRRHLLENIDPGNIPLAPDSIDLCHSGGTLERYRPEMVAAFLREAFRILHPGAVMSTSSIIGTIFTTLTPHGRFSPISHFPTRSTTWHSATRSFITTGSCPAKSKICSAPPDSSRSPFGR